MSQQPQIVLLIGPPGVGKSTLAKEYEQQGFIRINQDDQGKMLHKTLFSATINDKKNIVLDRMNFDKIQRNTYLQPAKIAGYKTKIIVLHETKDICFKRCLERKDHPTIKTKEDAQKAISFFFRKYEKPTLDEADEIEFKYNPSIKGTCIIVDLDGTLCNIDHRLHYIRNKNKRDWKKFFDELSYDTVNNWCDLIIRSFKTQYETDIVLCSGRPSTYMLKTYNWLYENKIVNDELFMRPSDDHRQDAIVKCNILDFEIRTRYNNILFVLDDRPNVCRMWRKEGLTVLQCNDKEF